MHSTQFYDIFVFFLEIVFNWLFNLCLCMHLTISTSFSLPCVISFANFYLIYLFFLFFLSTSLRRNFLSRDFFNNKVKLISGTLTVNVSVLLLSLASPDESSLVSSTSCFQLSKRKLQHHCRFIKKINLNSLSLFLFFLEIRS